MKAFFILLISFIPCSLSTRCYSHSECRTLSAPVCSNNACVPCSLDSDCSHIAAGSICDKSYTPALCLPPCDSNHLCPYRRASHCDMSTNYCKPCTKNSECEDAYPYTTCYSGGICGNCVSNSDCSNSRICVNNKCSVCNLASSGCSDVARRCIEDEMGVNSCNSCVEDLDCPGTTNSYCHVDGTCGRKRCTTTADCDPSNANNRICYPNGYCYACLQDSDCGLGLICDNTY